MTDLAMAATIISRAMPPENARRDRRVRPQEGSGSDIKQHDRGEQSVAGEVGDDQHLARAVGGGRCLYQKPTKK